MDRLQSRGVPAATLRAVAAGTGLSMSYLAMLRSGRRKNPTMKALQRLADFFGVPLAYFYEEVPVASIEGSADGELLQRRLNEAELAIAERRLDSAQVVLEGVAPRTSALLDPALRGRALRALGRLHRLRGSFDEAAGAFGEALELERGRRAPIEIAETLLELGRAEYDQQRYASANRYYAQALEGLDQIAPGPADGHGLASLRLHILHGLGILQRHLGRPETAVRYLTEALELATRLSDPRRLAHVYMGLALVQKDLDRAAAALEASARAVDIYRALDDLKLIADTQHNMALVLLDTGRLEEARKLLEQSRAAHQSLHDDRGVGHNCLLLARYHFLAGRFAEAQTWGAQALDTFVTLRLPQQTGDTQVQLGEISAAAGDEAAARRLFEDGIAALERHGLHADLARGLRKYADVLVQWGYHEEATGLYRRSLELYAQI